MATTQPQKLSRHLAHVSAHADTPIVFLTVTTHKRRRVLSNDKAHQILRGIWERSADHDGWFVGDYILMPDHLHLFARPSRTARQMQNWVKMWKSVSARQIISNNEPETHLWQAEYFDRYLRSSDSYSEKWDYVRDNPVRAGLVKAPDEWQFKGRIFDLMF